MAERFRQFRNKEEVSASSFSNFSHVTADDFRVSQNIKTLRRLDRIIGRVVVIVEAFIERFAVIMDTITKTLNSLSAVNVIILA